MRRPKQSRRRWKWVEAAEDIPYNATYGLRPLLPVSPALTNEKKHELETLLNERDELAASKGGRGNPEKRLNAALDAIIAVVQEAEGFGWSRSVVMPRLRR